MKYQFHDASVTNKVKMDKCLMMLQCSVIAKQKKGNTEMP